MELCSPETVFSIPDLECNVVDSVRGVLLMQDVQLGILMALLPFFQGGTGPAQSVGVWLLQLLQVLFGLPVLVLVVRSLATRVIGKFHRYARHPSITFTGMHGTPL